MIASQTAVIDNPIHVRRPARPRVAIRRQNARVLVIGAGPAGLATVACLKQAGIQADTVDKCGRPGGAYGRLYGGITLSSPARFTQLPGLPIESGSQYVTIGEYREYLVRYADHFGIVPEEQTVERMERVGDGFEVKFASDNTPRHYDAVVAATGMCDYPVWPNIQGLTDRSPSERSPCDRSPSDGSRPKVMHSREWPGVAALAGKRILIIGGASSAIAIAEQCAAAGTRVVVSTRQKQVRFSLARILGYDLRRWTYPLARRLPRWLFGARCSLRPSFPGTDKGFRTFRKAGLIDVRGPVVRFEGQDAVFETGPNERFDVVVLATGFRFNMPFLPAEVARAPAGQPTADQGESRSWPGLYFVGIPCARTVSSEFLHGMAADAPIVARRIAARCRNKLSVISHQFSGIAVSPLCKRGVGGGAS